VPESESLSFWIFEGKDLLEPFAGVFVRLDVHFMLLEKRRGFYRSPSFCEICFFDDSHNCSY
jgi:hypothetical protein